MKIREEELRKIAIIVIVLSFIGSAIFACYNHFNERNKEEYIEEYTIKELLGLANDLYYQGDYEGSIAKYQEVIAREENEEAYINLAVIYKEMGNYELAVNKYRRLLLNKEDFKFRLGLGVSLYNLGDFNQAKEELSKVVKAKESKDYILREANYYLGLIFCQLGDYQRAEKYLNHALEYNQFALGFYQLGQIKFANKKYQEAIKYYKKALQVDGSLIGIKKRLGFAYLNLEQIKEGIEYLKMASYEEKNDLLIQNKLAELEEEYPEYFIEEEKILPQDREYQIPEKVEFTSISPLKESGQLLRIGIMDSLDEVYFRVGSDFVVREGDKVLASGKKGDLCKGIFVEDKYQLVIGKKRVEFNDSIQIIPKEYASIIVHNVIYGKGYYWGGSEDREYRGQLELRAVQEGITLINLVHLEEYLLAVIPSEMSASWPVEALKSQAVAARSYTLANLGRHKEDGYDLCSDVHCAAYRGINREHKQSNKAVIETAGEVMMSQGRPINAVYSANSGGHTENSEDVWNFEISYLKGVSTEKEADKFPLAPAELEEWLKKIPDSYSKESKYTKLSHYRWQRNLTVEYIEGRTGVKNIKEIIPKERGKAGSVKSLVVIGEDEKKEFKRGLRSLFGGLRSNRFWIQPRYQAGKLVSFLFYGSGWGHSVGMDQVAAAGMADDGYNYKEILKHFYSGISIKIGR